jgi:NB-ARC domain
VQAADGEHMAHELAMAVQRAFMSARWLVIIDDVWDAVAMCSDAGLGLLPLASRDRASSVVVTARHDFVSDWDVATRIKLREADNEPQADAMLRGFVFGDRTEALPADNSVLSFLLHADAATEPRSRMSCAVSNVLDACVMSMHKCAHCQ